MSNKDFWRDVILGCLEIVVIGLLGYHRVLQSEAIVGLLTASIAIRGKAASSGASPGGALPAPGLAGAGLLGVVGAGLSRLAQRSRLTARYAVPIVAGLALTACAAAVGLVHALVVAACPYVPTPYGTVCESAAPLVTAVGNEIVTLAGNAAVARIDPATCARAQITPDGATVVGSVCVQVCGDMGAATVADPCPKVDAALRQQAELVMRGVK